MATREFKSTFIDELANKAVIGYDNHIINGWKKDCRSEYELHLNYNARKNKSWLRKLFRRTPLVDLSFDEFCGYRKTWPYGIYSDAYTKWDDYIGSCSNSGNLIARIARLSEINDEANRLTRIDDSEYNLLVYYSKVKRNDL